MKEENNKDNKWLDRLLMPFLVLVLVFLCSYIYLYFENKENIKNEINEMLAFHSNLDSAKDYYTKEYKKEPKNTDLSQLTDLLITEKFLEDPNLRLNFGKFIYSETENLKYITDNINVCAFFNHNIEAPEEMYHKMFFQFKEENEKHFHISDYDLIQIKKIDPDLNGIPNKSLLKADKFERDLKLRPICFEEKINGKTVYSIETLINEDNSLKNYIRHSFYKDMIIYQDFSSMYWLLAKESEEAATKQTN